MSNSPLIRSTCAVLFLLVALPLSAATFTVTNINDSGAGSLRQAMLDADATAAVDTIAFSIGTGPQRILPVSNLPSLDHPVVIDGRTQPGYAGRPIIEIDGIQVPGKWATGLAATDVDIYGLVVSNFSAYGIVLEHGRIENCHIGTNIAGTHAKGNLVGILVFGGSIVTIGGSGNAGNLISGNAYGIVMDQGASATIQGNAFGTNLAGTATLRGMYGMKVHIDARSTDGPIIIGGEAPNHFEGGFEGVSLWYADNATIEDNHFAGGFLEAITIHNSSDNLVQRNVIEGSNFAVRVSGDSLGNRILGNSMHGNDFGIDLSPTFPNGPVTPNDPGDSDVGPNNHINFPVLGQITTQGQQTTIPGTLSTVPNRRHRIEIFSNPSCNSSGYGEGKTLIDSFDVTTDGSGTAAFTRTVNALAQGTVITATATSDVDGTSEFSACKAVAGPGTFVFSNAASHGLEGETFHITVKRLGGSFGPASVTYAVTGGTATGADYPVAAGTLTFADGETLKILDFATTDDAMIESAETIVLSLSGPTNGATIGSPASVTVTLADNETAPNVILENVSVAEGNSATKTIQVPISLSAPIASPYAVDYVLAPYTATAGDDFIIGSGTITFAPGETAKSIPVTIIGDTVWERDEFLQLQVSAQYWVTSEINILNDDATPSVQVEPLSILEGDTTSTVTVTLRASQPVTGTVQILLVDGTAHAPGDFAPSTTSLFFDSETTKTFPVSIAGDAEPESDEFFTVRLINNSTGFTVHDGTVTIRNDDVGVGPAEQWIAAGSSDKVTILLGQAFTEDVTVSLASDTPSAVSVASTLVIPAGRVAESFAVSALIPHQTATVTVTFPPAAGGETHSVRVRTYAKTTLHFSPERVTMFEGGTAEVEVTLDPPSLTATTLGLKASDAVDAPRSLTIPAGGSASFIITAKRTGSFTIDAKLPPVHGNEIQYLLGSVVEKPATPTIVDLTPSHGPGAGGTEVRVSGVNFRRECTILFGGVPAASLAFESTTAMTAISPPHAGGTVDVSLLCGSDAFVLRDGFVYRSDTPRVSSVSPASGTTEGGTHVRITGEHFDGSCWLFFGRLAAGTVVVRDAESITGVAPPHGPGSSDVTVRCSGGATTLPAAYTYRSENDPAPLITEISPSAAAPGELVTIHGVNFRPTDTAAIDTAHASIVDPAPEAHVVRVPELPPGQTSVSITDRFGRTTTSGPLFSILEVRPVRITAAEPQIVTGGAELTLTGEGFLPAFTFEIGGHTATTITLDSTHAVVRLSPETAAGSQPVHVRNSANALAAVGPNVDVIASGMVLVSAEPRCALTDGGVYTTLRGNAFTAGATVAFDDIPSEDVIVVDRETVRALVPAGAAGPAKITLDTGTARTTLTNAFRYVSPFDPRGCGGRTRTVRH